MDSIKKYKIKSLAEEEKKSIDFTLKSILKFQTFVGINDITLIPWTLTRVRYKGNIEIVKDLKLDFIKILYPYFITVEENDPLFEEQYNKLEKEVDFFKKIENMLRKNLDDRIFSYMISSLTDDQKGKLYEKGQVDYSIWTEYSNYRLNISFLDEGSSISPFISIRKINKTPYTLEQMNITPEILHEFKRGSGLILISWPTGSAKSSTLTSVLDYYNKNEYKKIITIEDPIEFFWPKESWEKSIILQREVDKTVTSFSEGLKAWLRANPDIVIIWELRDRESVEMAIETASTWHLVIATIHINSSIAVVDRILSFFEWEKSKEVASKLSWSLNFVLNQRLISTNKGYKVAYEYIKAREGWVPNLIKNQNLKDLKEKMRELREDGTKPHKTLSESLYEFILKGWISEQEVIEKYINEGETIFKDNFEEYKIKFIKENNLDPDEIEVTIKTENEFYRKKKEKGIL